MDIKGIVFDMDGTMFDTELISLEAMKLTAERYGIRLNRETMLGFIGLSGSEIKRRFLKIIGSDFDYDSYRLDKIIFQDNVIAENGVPIKPGLLELLNYAREKNILCAVATSTSRDRADALIKRAGIFDYFSAIVYGDDIVCGKPAPDIFILAAEKLGLPPSQCMGIEDSKNGILAVQKSGMLSVLIPDVIKPDDTMKNAASLLYDNLFEVKKYLEKLD